MYLPVLAEAVRLAHLPSIAVTIRAVVTLDEGGVDLVAYRRVFQGFPDCLWRAEDDAGFYFDDSALPACFVNGGIVEVWGRHKKGGLGPSGFAGFHRRDRCAIGVEDGPFIRGIFIAGDQVHLV